MDNQATVAVSIQACRHFRRHTQKNQENLFLQIYFRVYSYHEISGTNPQFFLVVKYILLQYAGPGEGRMETYQVISTAKCMLNRNHDDSQPSILLETVFTLLLLTEPYHVPRLGIRILPLQKT